MSGADRSVSRARASRRGLTALLVAETISTAGTRMSAVALPWLVLTDTGSPTRAGLVLLVEMLPFVLMQILGAPVIDRLGAKRVAVAGNLGAGLALAAVPVLALADDLALVPLLACVFVAGLLRGPADSATAILLPGVAEQGAVPIDRATGLVDGVQRAASLLGAPVGAALIAVIGASSVVALDAATFAMAAGLFAAAVPREAGVTGDPAEHSESTYLAQLAAGLAYLVRDRLLRSIAGMVLLTNFVDAALSGLLLVVWARERFGSAGPIGYIGGALGAGAVLGAVLVSTLGPRLPRRSAFGVAFVIAGPPRLLVLIADLPLWVVVAVWAVSGIGAGAINPLLGAAEYDRIPRPLQARVLGALGGIAWAGIPFGALLAGALVAATSLRTALIAGAVLYLVANLDPFVRSAWSLMNRSAAAEVDEPRQAVAAR